MIKKIEKNKTIKITKKNKKNKKVITKNKCL